MIRPFELTDCHAIEALLLIENSYHYDLEPEVFNKLSQETLIPDDWLEAVYDNPNEEILLMDNGIEITGLIMFTEGFTTDPLFKMNRWVHINEICVLPKERGKGIGKALIGEVESYAKEVGIQTVKLEVWSSNKTARAVYDRLGYEIKKEIRYKKGIVVKVQTKGTVHK